MKKSTAKTRDNAKNNTQNVKERSIENYLRDEVKKRGGFCIKQNPAWEFGVPDRLVILPGLMCLVECKRLKGGKLHGKQPYFKKRLREMQIAHYVLHTFEMIDEFLKPYPLKESTRHENSQDGRRRPF